MRILFAILFFIMETLNVYSGQISNNPDQEASKDFGFLFNLLHKRVPIIQELRVIIKSNKADYYLGESVNLKLIIENIGSEKVIYNKRLSYPFDIFFSIRNSDGKNMSSYYSDEADPSYEIRKDMSEQLDELEPGERFISEISLFDPDSEFLYDFPHPDRYQIKGMYVNRVKGCLTGIVESNEISIKVDLPQTHLTPEIYFRGISDSITEDGLGPPHEVLINVGNLPFMVSEFQEIYPGVVVERIDPNEKLIILKYNTDQRTTLRFGKRVKLKLIKEK